MNDIVFLMLSVGFFLATLGLVVLAERLSGVAK